MTQYKEYTIYILENGDSHTYTIYSPTGHHVHTMHGLSKYDALHKACRVVDFHIG